MSNRVEYTEYAMVFTPAGSFPVNLTYSTLDNVAEMYSNASEIVSFKARQTSWGGLAFENVRRWRLEVPKPKVRLVEIK